jgi:peptidoglycan/LPS O-acetylase OafA/YrhL
MRRVGELDSLRGLAALAIVAYHLWFTNVALLGSAVDLFFVLSGYLITTIILTNQATEGFLITFYVRRSLRIWPIYYVSLLALVLLNPLLPAPARLDGLPYYLTYTQKLPHYWLGIEPPFSPAFQHTWTLAIEEQFYVLWPALICLLGRRWLVPLAGGLVLVALSARGAGMNPWLLATHCDGLALGGLLAVLLIDTERGVRGARVSSLVLVVVGLLALSFPAWGGRLPAALALIAPIAAQPSFLHSLKVFFINLGYFSIVGLTVIHAGRPALGWLRLRGLVFIGQISYGLYLYHHIVFFVSDDWARARGFGGAPWIDAVKVALTFALAALSWAYVERPILALKDRFSYRRRFLPSRSIHRDTVGLPDLPGLDAAR